MAEFVKVAELGDIPDGEGRAFAVRGAKIAIFNMDGELYAIDDTCTHDEASLAEGWLEGDAVECPLHGAQFNVKTGEALSMPAVVGVNQYRLQIEGDEILIEVE